MLTEVIGGDYGVQPVGIGRGFDRDGYRSPLKFAPLLIRLIVSPRRVNIAGLTYD